ncbi:tetratricopeptide repeat protein [Candidatus Peregrinibacteria bacterium]|nr:tetratricopeptide repeat protein [Candidatus Peregrinibacteria bacterium]
MSKKTKIVLGIISGIILILVGLVVFSSMMVNESDPRFQELMQQVDKNDPGVVAKSSVDISLMPMYGEVEKTPEQKKSDEEFIDAVVKAAGSREKAATDAIARGKDFLQKGDLEMAMRRFNQAWLLDSNNPDVYVGFGDVLKKQGNDEGAAEMYSKAENLKK